VINFIFFTVVSFGASCFMARWAYGRGHGDGRRFVIQKIRQRASAVLSEKGMRDSELSRWRRCLYDRAFIDARASELIRITNELDPEMKVLP